MWFCVMTFLILHKELLSWIYCIIESWPQGFVREISCSQMPKILRQFTSRILVILKSTVKNLYSFGDKIISLLKHELSIGTYGPHSGWLEFLVWISKERNIHSLGMMECPSHPLSGKGLEQTFTRILSILTLFHPPSSLIKPPQYFCPITAI